MHRSTERLLEVRREDEHPISANSNRIVGARSFPGNPSDNHTLGEKLELSRILTDHKPFVMIVDLD